MAQLSTSRWLLYTCLGGIAGILLGVVLLPLTALMGFGAGLGLGVGIFQARGLNYGLPAGGRKVNGAAWAAISAGGGLLPGWLLAFALVMGASNGGAPVRDPIEYIGGVSGAAALFGGVGAAVCGGLVGLAHGLVLRAGRPNPGASLGWAAASAAGWGLSWAAQGGGLGLLITGHNAGGAAGIALTTLGGLLVLAGWAPYALLTAPILAAWGDGPVVPGAAGMSAAR